MSDDTRRRVWMPAKSFAVRLVTAVASGDDAAARGLVDEILAGDLTRETVLMLAQFAGDAVRWHSEQTGESSDEFLFNVLSFNYTEESE